MNHSDIERTQNEISKFLESKKLADALKRLRNNADFKLVIEQGYQTKFLDNLVVALAVVASEANVNQMHRQIAGVGSLKHFLETIENNGLSAERELPTLEYTLEQLRAGVADE